MFNNHSLIPWGSLWGRQEEKWGSFWGWGHFGVKLGIISGLGIINFQGQDHFGGSTCLWHNSAHEKDVIQSVTRATGGLVEIVTEYFH